MRNELGKASAGRNPPSESYRFADLDIPIALLISLTVKEAEA